MLVGQSAVICSWFKGGELAMAFGINSTILRIGSFANGPLMLHLADTKSVGFSFMVGFYLCVFSLASGICLVLLDTYAEKKDNMKTILDENERFKCKDLKKFRLPYWLVNISSIFFYAAVFTYIANAEDMYVKNFGFTDSEASWMLPMPYIISAVCSPFQGLLIDKIGKRPFFSKLYSHPI